MELPTIFIPVCNLHFKSFINYSTHWQDSISMMDIEKSSNTWIALFFTLHYDQSNMFVCPPDIRLSSVSVTCWFQKLSQAVIGTVEVRRPNELDLIWCQLIIHGMEITLQQYYCKWRMRSDFEMKEHVIHSSSSVWVRTDACVQL